MEHGEVHEELLRGRILEIEIGTRLQLQVGAGSAEMKLNGTLIGMSPDEFLIVAIPAIPGVLAKLSEGSPVTVRYVFGGGVYGFTASVVSCIHKPKLLLFMSYPHALEIVNLRKTKRLISLLPASALIQQKIFEGVLMDLSQGGCKLSIESEADNIPIINAGEEVHITVHLTGAASPQVVRGIVQSVRRLGKFAQVGIKFDGGDSESIGYVKNYLTGISKLQEHVPSINRPLT